MNGSNAVFYANRSISYLRTECFGYALSDASKVGWYVGEKVS